MKIGGLLTIHVEYNVPDRYTLEKARNIILALLKFIPQDAASEGRLSGFTEITVDKWWSKAAIIVGPEPLKATWTSPSALTLQPYECPCGGIIGIDPTFLDQVQPTVTLACPYCRQSIHCGSGDNV